MRRRQGSIVRIRVPSPERAATVEPPTPTADHPTDRFAKGFSAEENGQAVMDFDDEDAFASPNTQAADASQMLSTDMATSAGNGSPNQTPPLNSLSDRRPSHTGQSAARRAKRLEKSTVIHRMRHAAFASVTNRDGHRFMVLQQEGSLAPILRDFADSRGLINYIKAQEGRFSALTVHDSDIEEPDAHRLERSLSRLVSRTWRHESSSSSSSSSKSKSSSSSSSTSTMSGLAPERTLWIDIQCEDQDVIEEVLCLFPRLDRDTVDDVLQHDALDTAHWFHTHRYLFANIECSLPETLGSSMIPKVSSHPFDHHGATIVVSLIAFSDVCITVHARPFAGHRSMLQALYGITSRSKRGPVGMTATAAHVLAQAAAGGVGAPPETPAPQTATKLTAKTGNQPTHKRRVKLTVGTVVATLIECIVIAALPDPTSSLNEVDRIDEMVLLVTKDSRDLLRRIARIRRILSAQRSALFRKERFLQQFTSPVMKATFISGFNSEQYRHTLGEVYHVAERLEAARDVLTQANSNFVSHISLQMSQVSNQMNKQMKTLSQVATICLPLNIITGTFGMNVEVPFQTGNFNTLVAFFVIVAVMALYLVISIPLMWSQMRDTEYVRTDIELAEDQ
jgi:Mg2+ and Co2+ transporter CorA